MRDVFQTALPWVFLVVGAVGFIATFFPGGL